MKSRETVVRLRKFDFDDKQQKVADLEIMVAEFARMAEDLDQQIATEEQRAGVTDANHFSYPPFAKAAMLRRDNLKASVDDLEIKLRAAKVELGDAHELLRNAEQREERRQDGGATGSKSDEGTSSQVDARGL